MRITALLREVWRDVITGTTGTVLFALLFSVVVAGLTFMDLGAITSLNRQAQKFHSSMASVTVLQAPGRVDGQACESLNQLTSTRAAAIRVVETPLVPAQLPSSAVRTYESTPSIGNLLRSETTTPGGLYLSTAVADSLHVTAGQEVQFSTGSAMLAGVFDWDETDGRRIGYGYSAFVPTTTSQPFDECWLDTWPINPEIIALLPTTLLPPLTDQPEPVTTVQLNTSLGSTFNGQAMFEHRPTRYAVVAVAGLSFALGFVATRRRRLEIASDLHARVSRTDLSTKHLIETLSWAVPSLVIATPVIAWFVAANHSREASAIGSLGAANALAGIAAALLGTTAALALTREHHLNRYFKNR